MYLFSWPGREVREGSVIAFISAIYLAQPEKLAIRNDKTITVRFMLIPPSLELNSLISLFDLPRPPARARAPHSSFKKHAISRNDKSRNADYQEKQIEPEYSSREPIGALGCSVDAVNQEGLHLGYMAPFFIENRA